jgi:hypothetical protein
MTIVAPVKVVDELFCRKHAAKQVGGRADQRDCAFGASDRRRTESRNARPLPQIDVDEIDVVEALAASTLSARDVHSMTEREGCMTLP